MREAINLSATHRLLRAGTLAAVLLIAALPIVTGAQRGEGPPPPAPARAGAPIDLTGYWVSVVTEDWRYRMVTPQKGDYASVPLNAAARQVADSWDPAKDEASGNACKSYGAANIMRVPGRAHITWQDDNTLKIEMDAGTQTRLLHFGNGQPATDANWQGYSAAQWEYAGRPMRGARGGGGGAPVAGRSGAGDIGADAQRGGGAPAGGVVPPAPAAPGQRGRGPAMSPMARGGSLKVVTTHLKAGYLRKNGVPYSDRTMVTEYFDRHNEPNGDQWFTVTTIVEDPTYLLEPFITSTHFKKEKDAAKWRPTACTAG